MLNGHFVSHLSFCGFTVLGCHRRGRYTSEKPKHQEALCFGRHPPQKSSGSSVRVVEIHKHIFVWRANSVHLFNRAAMCVCSRWLHTTAQRSRPNDVEIYMVAMAVGGLHSLFSHRRYAAPYPEWRGLAELPRAPTHGDNAMRWE